MNAICFPSGLNFGIASAPAGEESGRATPPRLSTSQRSPANRKTIESLLTSGLRSITASGRNCARAGAAAPSATTHATTAADRHDLRELGKRDGIALIADGPRVGGAGKGGPGPVRKPGIVARATAQSERASAT